MADPVTLATLEGAALTQGINFLYGQATELLKRRRDRKEGSLASAAEPTPQPRVIEASVLAGELNLAKVDDQVVESRSEELFALTEKLSSYANGIRYADPSDLHLIALAESLRGILELIYQQRITFAGEGREPTGSTVDLKLVAARVDGELTVAEVGQVKTGAAVKATGELGDVGPNAKVIGFRGDVVGG
jgi:hypothetical protein